MEGRVCELFAGVGGFRLGLESAGWKVVWSNQWEPSRKTQHASRCYTSHFGDEGHSNQDIALVPARRIPNHDLLVGGFPCQDYSVATTAASGIHGKKGVLWWEIFRIASEKRPPYILLENVDRLLKSPTPQRGRDFAVMLSCLNKLGYSVEWRVLNAADYGGAQKRRRVFVLASQPHTNVGLDLSRTEDMHLWLLRTGFFASAFPRDPLLLGKVVPPSPTVTLPKSLQDVSSRFAFAFQTSGVMVGGKIWTSTAEPIVETSRSLRNVLQSGVPREYYVNRTDLPRWRYLKGAKAEARKSRNGFEYAYTEGALPFPDQLDCPARTVMTDEGGLSPSRFRHIIRDPETDKYRVLTPVEVERLNDFPDGWTETGMPRSFRYFCMGNALVVGLVRRMGVELANRQGKKPIGISSRTRIPA